MKLPRELRAQILGRSILRAAAPKSHDVRRMHAEASLPLTVVARERGILPRKHEMGTQLRRLRRAQSDHITYDALEWQRLARNAVEVWIRFRGAALSSGSVSSSTIGCNQRKTLRVVPGANVVAGACSDHSIFTKPDPL